MSYFDTGSDLLQNVARRSSEILPTETDTSAMDHLTDLRLYINEAYWDVCALRAWRWARRRVQFASVAEVTGTVGAISGATVALTATIATSMAGRKFQVDSDAIPHRIAAHTAGTNGLTLETDYTGDALSGAFTIYQDEITVLSNILAFPRVKQLNWSSELILVSEGELFELARRNVIGSTNGVRYGAFLGDSSDANSLKLHIAPWTQNAELFEISYNIRPDPLDFSGGAGDTPILPRDQRVVIALRALVKLFADKRDERLAVATQEFTHQLEKMSAQDTALSKPRLTGSFSLSRWR